MADSVARRPHTATSVRGLVSPPSPILPSSHSSSGAAFHCCFVCLFFSFFFFFSLLSSSHFLHFPTPRLDVSCHHSTSILRSSSLVFFPLVTPFIDVPVPPAPSSPFPARLPPPSHHYVLVGWFYSTAHLPCCSHAVQRGCH